MEYYKNIDLLDINYYCEFDAVFKTEQWMKVRGYQSIYQVSDLGRVKSLCRIVNNHSGNRVIKERILKQNNSNVYLIIGLNNNNKHKKFYIHQLVAIAFLNHTPCGMNLVVNHKNFKKTDNRKLNLEIITSRENGNKKQIKSSSKYVGIHWSRFTSKWIANIRINGIKKHLGCFNNEYDAHLAYESKLKDINQ